MAASELTVTRADVAQASAYAALVDAADGSLFHTPAWLGAVEAVTGHGTHVLIARHGAQIVAALPLHCVHSALFGRALVSTGFGVGGGVIGDPAATPALLVEAERLAARLACATVELRGGPLVPLPGWMLTTDSHLGFMAPLAADDDAQLAAIPRKQRAEVRKGLAHDLRVEIGRGAQQRAWHYTVYAESVRNLGTPVFPRRLFAAMLDAFAAEADILTVLAGDTPVASVLSFYHRGAVMPYWGGGTAAARGLRANDVMYFALMRHARARGMAWFDFGRSKAGSGAAAFKRNWGFAGTPLSYARWTADGAPPRDVNPLSPRYRLKIALWQRLPLALANRLGPWIAAGLA